MKTWKNVIYLSLALGMLIYAVPRIAIGGGLTLPTIFGVVWILFALTVIAAHLHRIIGVDEAKEEELRQVRRLARVRREQWLHRRLGTGDSRSSK
ncbi:MAG: hypothetical protein K0R67_2144 [Paenibacillus sp.]|nr:hypothetical protein [Paenibacillus sp.]